MKTFSTLGILRADVPHIELRAHAASDADLADGEVGQRRWINNVQPALLGKPDERAVSVGDNLGDELFAPLRILATAGMAGGPVVVTLTDMNRQYNTCSQNSSEQLDNFPNYSAIYFVVFFYIFHQIQTPQTHVLLYSLFIGLHQSNHCIQA